jgi:hypothetical protein
LNVTGAPDLKYQLGAVIEVVERDGGGRGPASWSLRILTGGAPPVIRLLPSQ